VNQLQSSFERLLVAARGFAADAVGRPFDRVTEVSRFPDGNRHAVYKVSYLERTGEVSDVVVRVSYGANEAECEAAKREARVLRTVGGRAAPTLYDFRCMSRWLDRPAMCVQFVSACQRELSSASTAEIEKLGSVLAWVHQRPVYDLAYCLGPMTNIVSYAEARLESTWWSTPTGRFRRVQQYRRVFRLELKCGGRDVSEVGCLSSPTRDQGDGEAWWLLRPRPGDSPNFELVVGETESESAVRRGFREHSSEVSLELRQMFAEQMRCRGGVGEGVGHQVVGGPSDGTAVGNHDDFGAGEPGRSKDGSLVAGGGVPDALTSSTVFTEIPLAQGVDLGHGRRREVVIEAEAVLVAVVDMHDDAIRFEHPSNDPGNERPIHPMKRCREGDHPECAQEG
jgi:hypothetical protein